MPEDRPDPHSTLHPRGVPCLDGTCHWVLDLVADHVAHGDSAAHIVEPYPDLTPAQVYAALTYYDDHQEAMDAALVASDVQAEHQDHDHTPHPKLVAARAQQAGSWWRLSMDAHVKACHHGPVLRWGCADSTAEAAVKVREVIALVEADGWVLVRTRGDHRQYKHPTKPGLVTVSGQRNDDVHPKTLNSILTQAGLRRRTP